MIRIQKKQAFMLIRSFFKFISIKKQREKILLSFLFAFLIFNISYSGARVISFCKTAFFREKAFLEEHTFKNATAKTLVSGYQSIKDLKWLNKKQTREFEKGLKEMVEFLEQTPKATQTLQGLNVPLDVLINKAYEIIEFTKKSPLKEDIYFRQITKALLALFSKHLPSILKSHSYQVDWSRVNLIAKNISEFDTKKPRFSFYKIKRAIEGRYSLKEFILCLM